MIYVEISQIITGLYVVVVVVVVIVVNRRHRRPHYCELECEERTYAIYLLYIQVFSQQQHHGEEQ